MGFDVLPIRMDVARIMGFGCQRGLVAAQSYLLSTKFRGIIIELGSQAAIFLKTFSSGSAFKFRSSDTSRNVMLWICCDSTILINDLDRDPA